MTIFESNLAFLSEVQPALANSFKNYRPGEIHNLKGTYPDLVKDNEPFYGMDARQACRQQVDLFFRQPSHFSLKLQNRNTQRCHQLVINNLNIVAENLGYSQKGKPQFSNLLVLGGGCGFHILELMQHLELRNIVLIEPNKDMLFHLLSNIDLRLLCTALEKNSGKLMILQCEDADSLMASMQQVLNHDIGYGFLSEITLFRHYETPFFNYIFENFKQLRAQLLSGWGFFEDECVGLRNSLANFHQNGLLKMSNKSGLAHSATPVLIVGNGPSLDENLESIRELKGSFLICSCGTALASLLNNGIVPDIHVEMERSSFTAQVQKEWLKSDLLDSTILCALSTVPTETTSLFKHQLIFTKANDVGGFLLNKAVENHAHPLSYCNPTVTNLALSATLRLGFTDIVLLGCDYGFRDASQHHSSNSDYYNKNSVLSRSRYRQEFQVQDNFGNKIYTTRQFNQAKLNIEKLIKAHPQANIQNGSNGVRIFGAPYVDFKSLPPGLTDKHKAKSALLKMEKIIRHDNHHLAKYLEDSLQTVTEVLAQLRAIATETDSPEKGSKLLHSLSVWLKQKLNHDLSAVFMVGDIRYLSLLIAGHLNRLNGSELNQYWEAVTHEITSACVRYEAQLSSIRTGEGYEI